MSSCITSLNKAHEAGHEIICQATSDNHPARIGAQIMHASYQGLQQKCETAGEKNKKLLGALANSLAFSISSAWEKNGNKRSIGVNTEGDFAEESSQVQRELDELKNSCPVRAAAQIKRGWQAGKVAAVKVALPVAAIATSYFAFGYFSK